ncbi:MAG: tetratricopeptide repeat protein [Bacteroidales bacterium]|nr:tetratricopeptide repeat protein [Bacteroidales bacterium]
MPYDVFISYASEDIAIAQELNDRLVNEGFKVWFDKTRLTPGFDWYKEIEHGCENSRVVLPVLTPHWKNSEWTKFETYGAEAVFPILFEGLWSDVSTPPLERFQAEMVDMNKKEGADWPRLISDIHRVMESQLPEKASHLTHIHYRANPFFTGREIDLIKIHEELHTKPIPGLTTGRVRAITAMGGAGKTTLVREYVEKFWRCYSQMLWVDCRIGMEREFAHIHDILFPERKDIGLKDDDKANSALNELNSDISRLLILDNADGLEEAVIDWVPTTGACHTLITSRFSSFGAAIETIHLFLLDKSHSVELLKKRTKREVKGAELVSCEALVEQLGYLPLALEQAGAFIFQQGDYFGFGDYLLEYEKSKNELLDIKVLGSNMYPDSVITTWNSTISKLSPTGRAILHLLSYLAPIPMLVEHLIKVTAIICDHAEKFYSSSSLKENIGKTLWLRNELAKLKAYSMIEYDGHSFSMHPLLQVVEQITDSPEQINITWNQAAEILIEIAPPASWADDCRLRWSLINDKLWSSILSHISNLEKIILQRDQNKKQIIIVPDTFKYLQINALASQNQFSDALEIGTNLEENLKWKEKNNVIFNLQVEEAIAYLFKQGKKYEKSLEAFTNLSLKCIENYGEMHRITFRIRHNIACELERLKRSEEAEKIMLDVLEKRKKELGEFDYDTITSIHDHGWLLNNSDTRWKEAEPLFQLALEQWKKTLGLENPDTRIASENLVRLLLKKGDFAQAEKIQRDLLAGTEAILGKDHIECYGLKHNLALYIHNNGRFEEAYQIILEVVNGYRMYLTPDHRNMLTSLQDMGTVLGHLNRYEEGLSYLLEALSGYEKTQNPDSADILMTLGNIAYLLDKAGRKEEAKPYHLRVIRSKIKNNNLDSSQLREVASDCYSIGDYDLAESLLKKVLLDEFEISSTYCNLARIYLMMNKIDDAIENIQKAMEHRIHAKSYVLARIIWFSILFRYLKKPFGDKSTVSLKTVLIDENAFNPWNMQPVLDHIRPQITEYQHAFLSALVDAMSKKDNLEKLNEFTEWRNAKPDEIGLLN